MLVYFVSSSKCVMEEIGWIFEKRGECFERLVDMLVMRLVGGVEGSVVGSLVFLLVMNLILDWM